MRNDPWPRRDPWEPPAGPAEGHGAATESGDTGLFKGPPGTGTRSAADHQETSIRPPRIGGSSVVPAGTQASPRRDQQQSTAMSRAMADPQKTTKGPDVRLKQPRCAPSGTQWGSTGLSGPSRVLYGSCLCSCLAMLGHDVSTPGPEGVQRCGMDRYLEHPPATVLERAAELSEHGGAAVAAGWRHRPARGPQGEQREKANWVVGPRMERKGKNSASIRASRTVAVQKVRTREPLQEATPGGRPGRLGDAAEPEAPVDPGKLHASRASSSSDASTRDRPGGGRRGLAGARPFVQLPPGGAAFRPVQAPAKERCGPASDAVRQVLARR